MLSELPGHWRTRKTSSEIFYVKQRTVGFVFLIHTFQMHIQETARGSAPKSYSPAIFFLN